MPKFEAEFTVTSWDERPYEEDEAGRKLTHASVRQDVTGDLVGSGQAELLMSYAEDGTAHFVGLQRFEGSIDSRTGVVVFETVGDFDGEVASSAAKVVPGSGSGELAQMLGKGRFHAPHGSKATFAIDCTFE
jgi:Protein of unknown function (DUF3224)